MNRLISIAVAGVLLGSTIAQEVTLRLHHFLAPTSNVHAGYLEPWAKRVERDSDGRIDVQIYPSMQLGGAPQSLVDQVEDGVVDLVWTLPGYTAGRFPKSEVFELPFMSGKAEYSSQALCEYLGMHLEDEYGAMKVISLHTAGPGVFHTKGSPITSIEEMSGLQLRAPSRITTESLAALGAQPIGMPVPQVPESLSRGVIDGALLPWEVTVALRVAELVDSHTLFAGERGFYTSTFLFAMNPGSYRRLPDDLRAVIDANSIADSCEESRIAGANMDTGDRPGERLAQEQGNTIHIVPEDEVPQWQAAVQPVIDQWISSMDGAGADGERMLQDARDLIEKYETAD